MVAEATEHWEQKVRQPHPVYLKHMPEAFKVEIDSGVMDGEAGGWLAYDPTSGHVWPVKASYIDQHYVSFPPNTKRVWLSWS